MHILWISKKPAPVKVNAAMKCAGVAVLEDGPERYPEEPAARIFAAMA